MMDLKLENLPVNDDLIGMILSWENDPAIAPFITPHYEESELPLVTEADVRESLDNPEMRLYFICVDDKPIGIASIIRNFTALLKDDGHTAWLGIYIGDPDWRSKGIGAKVLDLYEEECRKLGYQRIELGVFSHNCGAIKLYEKSGFRRIGIIPHFTYAQGQWRDDVRMEKNLHHDSG
ncbi:GNAT family N-acetyltransferase [Trichococcus ilyis]|nr:GNAT family N-acetyltransferase [Trichococcus ilyis]